MRAVLQFAGEALDHRDFERFACVERRQQAGQARGEHRLAGARRADHQKIVAAGGCDLERALGRLLALHIAQVGRVERFVGEARDGRGSRPARPLSDSRARRAMAAAMISTSARPTQPPALTAAGR